MVRPAVVTHGGAGHTLDDNDGAQRAAELGRARLAGGANAEDGVLASVVDLEDDPRFNAGTGSNFRIDGQTIEMDAAIMTGDGRSGAVANLTAVRNPVLIANEVRVRTPHVLMAGEGALRFARALGYGPHDPATETARRKIDWARRGLKGLAGGDDEEFEIWKSVNLRDVWNFPLEIGEALGDTVGAVARDEQGRFAAAVSTGGTLLALKGRIGDTPLIGCGLHAGPKGAVAATGVGEEIVRRFLSKTVYDWIASGMPAQEACERGIQLIGNFYGAGLIAVDATSTGRASNRAMPSGTVE
ncbi:MAG: Isoaspartyl peptidase [Myxococcota bacterium]|nr:Isoaspartyl peptidase [Myxococcota bacterium]